MLMKQNVNNDVTKDSPIALYSIVLHCIALYCIVLCCIVPYPVVMCCVVVRRL